MANEDVLVVTEWRPCKKGESLRGFLSLELANGMVVRGCTWHKRADGASWVGLPSREYTTSSGEKAWSKIIDFVDKPSYLEFQQTARAAVQRFFREHPEAAAPETHLRQTTRKLNSPPPPSPLTHQRPETHRRHTAGLRPSANDAGVTITDEDISF